MPPGAPRDDILWNQRLEELRKYKQKFGHANVPQDYTANPRLGKWLHTQRQCNKNKSLLPERKRRLEELGVVFDPHEVRWHEQFRAAEQYFKEHRRWPMNGQEGFRWVRGQRYRYKNETLSEERVRLLNEAGFPWVVKRGPRRAAGGDDAAAADTDTDASSGGEGWDPCSEDEGEGTEEIGSPAARGVSGSGGGEDGGLGVTSKRQMRADARAERAKKQLKGPEGDAEDEGGKTRALAQEDAGHQGSSPGSGVKDPLSQAPESDGETEWGGTGGGSDAMWDAFGDATGRGGEAEDGSGTTATGDSAKVSDSAKAAPSPTIIEAVAARGKDLSLSTKEDDAGGDPAADRDSNNGSSACQGLTEDGGTEDGAENDGADNIDFDHPSRKLSPAADGIARDEGTHEGAEPAEGKGTGGDPLAPQVEGEEIEPSGAEEKDGADNGDGGSRYDDAAGGPVEAGRDAETHEKMDVNSAGGENEEKGALVEDDGTEGKTAAAAAEGGANKASAEDGGADGMETDSAEGVTDEKHDKRAGGGAGDNYESPPFLGETGNDPVGGAGSEAWSPYQGPAETLPAGRPAAAEGGAGKKAAPGSTEGDEADDEMAMGGNGAAKDKDAKKNHRERKGDDDASRREKDAIVTADKKTADEKMDADHHMAVDEDDDAKDNNAAKKQQHDRTGNKEAATAVADGKTTAKNMDVDQDEGDEGKDTGKKQRQELGDKADGDGHGNETHLGEIGNTLAMTGMSSAGSSLHGGEARSLSAGPPWATVAALHVYRPSAAAKGSDANASEAGPAKASLQEKGSLVAAAASGPSRPENFERGGGSASSAMTLRHTPEGGSTLNLLDLAMAAAKKDKEKLQEYERIVANKNAEIEELQQMLGQEKLATLNLASKVIQTEQDKERLEKRYVEKIKKMDEEVRELKSSNSSSKATIKDLEDIVHSDRKTKLELNNQIQTLQSLLTSLLEEEENFKTLMEKTERRKDLLRSQVKQLGIKIPPEKRLDGRAIAAAATADSRAAEEGEKRKIARRAETPLMEGPLEHLR